MTYEKLCALAMIAMVGVPASAKSPDKEIVVEARVLSPAEWSKRTGMYLDRGMAKTNFYAPLGPTQGVVRVNFHSDETGRASGIVMAGSSGSSQLDRAGMKVVKRIKTLSPLPAEFKANQSFQAVLIFADSAGWLKDQTALLAKEAKQRTAMIRAHPEQFASLPMMITAGR